MDAYSQLSQSDGYVLAGHFNLSDSYVTKCPQGIDDWIITYTLGGEGYFFVHGEQSNVHAGQIALIRTKTPHQYGTASGKHWHFVWAHFSSRIMETRLLPDDPLYIHSVDNESAQRRIELGFKQIIADSFERSTYWNALCENRLREIILLLAQRSDQQLDPRIEEMIHLLTSNMKEPIDITFLAKKIGLSPSRLSHLFKQNIGYSIIDYLNRMRIQQAALLFEHTDRNATEIALDVGFQNYNHFANQFRKMHRISPREYREKLQKGQD